MSSRTLSPPLGFIALEGDLARLAQPEPVAFRFHTSDPARLAQSLSAAHPELRQDGGGIVLERGVLQADVLTRHREPSFLLDADQPIIAELAAQIAAPVTTAAIRTLVSGHFTSPLYGEFWTASRAAGLRTGDCSEHAVLVGAIARKLGLPARVVVGWVAVATSSQGFAVGHAWAQIHDGTRWQDVDATPLGAEPGHYIIAGELEDEGPAYALSVLKTIASLQTSRIEVVAPRP